MTTETSNARGDVRGLVAKWREPKAKHVRPDTSEYAQGFAHGMNRCADELESALAAEGVQAGEVGAVPMTPERAAFFLRRFKADEKMLGPHEQQALDFAIAALSQHPEARGVVDEEAVEPCESGLPDCGPAVAWDSEGVGVCERCGRELGWLPAALTGERNG